ncbi:MAG: histidine--tRNA ligase [Flavobacteriales bacterium]|nr:histidine--tRNA ligase [Flavobacteriales bacterium]
MATKPSIPKGTRDFLPEQSLKRQFIFDTARQVFQSYGYVPIETPAMENLDTLLGKYGEEGDKLIYKILNNGDYLSKASDEKIEARDSQALSVEISDRALRYDLTVPFARFVVQNQNELSFPFKRYQIQPVWRADRPQKGRYREFYQCDVDVIGSNSLLNEAELLCIIDDVFNQLGLGDVTIRINNRKILSGIAESAGLSGYFQEMTVAIDKIDKIGVDGVKQEMIRNGLPEAGVKKALNLIKLKGEPFGTLKMLAGAVTGAEEAYKGMEEVRTLLKALPEAVREKVELDLTLARGLNYYTGAIIEVGHPDFPSSICGGGRYDDLTGIFGLTGMSGVGVSLGADRIYDLMEAKDLFPKSIKASSEVLFVNFGDAEAMQCLKLAADLRSEGISAEVYPDGAKMKKQMKYADDKGVRVVIIVGEEELKNGMTAVKNMASGDQELVAQKELTSFILQTLR